MEQSDWQRSSVPTLRELGLHTTEWSGTAMWSSERDCVKKHLTSERAAAAGVDVDRYFDADGVKRGYKVSGNLSKVVRRRERSAEDPERAQRDKEAEARRKRVRRIEDEKEDRDALRALARSRSDGAKLELEDTPAGLREIATDGTPRSAKTAGTKLRALTQKCYELLMHPTLCGIAHEELREVRVETDFWDKSDPTRQHWGKRVRPLKRFGVGSRVGEANQPKRKAVSWVTESGGPDR